jgi:Transcriptional regulator containing PAS, AAA-type ATPase, and DNA-binding domains
MPNDINTPSLGAVRASASCPATVRYPADAPPSFVGTSTAIATTLRTAERFAPYEHATVLVEGETGTGKSYLARHIHLRSPRARNTFHQVLLSALDDNLAASDLFGHLRGSYTDARQDRAGHFVTANRGTLFLDEIGKASLAVQRKLLHVIEHREIHPVGGDRPMRLDVRLIAATNVPIETLVREDEFLDDLAARLALFRVRLPPLRERREDIPKLVHQFIELRAPQCGHPSRCPNVHDELMGALRRASWPHNLRQLDGVVQQLLMESCGSRVITFSHCQDDLAYLRGDSRPSGLGVTPEQVRASVSELGSPTKTAQALGISRRTVYRYLGRFKVSTDEISA